MASKIGGAAALRPSTHSSEARLSGFADRGKDAEAKLQVKLTTLAEQTVNAFYRLPDMRSGSRKVTLADFLYMSNQRMYLLEAKEVAHEFRLPHGNFDSAQVARMRRFAMAGAFAYVLVYHKPIDLWRCLPVDVFRNREGGSWDLSSFPLVSLDYAFSEILHSNGDQHETVTHTK